MHSDGEINLAAYSTMDFLVAHAKTKHRERLKIADDMALQPGHHVLDVGCGPGLWTDFFTERVAPGGKVMGLDYDESFISYASEQARPRRELASFHVGDYYAIPFEDDTFDFVLSGNCLQHAEDKEAVFREMMRVTKPGGRIADWSYDGSVLIFHPMSPALLHRVIAGMAVSLEENPAPAPFHHYFDNYVGRRVRGIFRKLGLADLESYSYAIHKHFPLSDPARHYIASNAAWYVNTASPYLQEDEIRAWKACFDPQLEAYILDDEEFFYCMAEFLHIGRVAKTTA